MQKGRIHSFESMGLVDGPGIRTVLFLQGCGLRCAYCHNPDTWDIQGGREMDVAQVLKMIKRFRPYFGEKGGVTCSGGEPLLQIEFVLELFRACKEENISTCLDTAGYGYGTYDELLKFTDLVIFDAKHYNTQDYHKLTGGDFAVPTKFLKAVAKSEIPLWVRHVVVPDLTDSEVHIRRLREYIKGIPNVKRIELLPYHTLGVDKYKRMGLDYPLKDVGPMNKEKTKQLQSMFADDSL